MGHIRVSGNLICFDFRAWLQRAIKSMNLILVRRLIELACRSSRRVQLVIWWSEHPVSERPETVR
jgi:hypothetical protein